MQAAEALEELFNDNDSHDDDFSDMELSDSDDEPGKLTFFCTHIYFQNSHNL